MSIEQKKWELSQFNENFNSLRSHLEDGIQALKKGTDAYPADYQSLGYASSSLKVALEDLNKVDEILKNLLPKI